MKGLASLAPAASPPFANLENDDLRVFNQATLYADASNSSRASKGRNVFHTISELEECW